MLTMSPNDQPDSTSLDFEVLKEPWNMYQISDGSKVRIRCILKDVRRVIEDGMPKYSITVEGMIVVVCAPELKGVPTTPAPAHDKLQESIERADIAFDTIFYDNNDYILNDGARIKIYLNLGEITRTTSYDSNGDRIYIINHSATVNIKPPPQYSPQK